MKSFLVATSIFAFAALPVAAEGVAAPTAATAPAPVASKGEMLLAAGGARLAPVYRVTADGSAQIIFDGRLVTIPANTLSSADGKLTTSLSKRDVIALP